MIVPVIEVGATVETTISIGENENASVVPGVVLAELRVIVVPVTAVT